MRLETFFQKFDLFADAPDAVAKMRELVLELAVQGKLVNQIPAEGDGHELLRHIRKKNPASVTDADSGSVESDPANFPASWACSTLGEVAQIIRGITFPGSAKSETYSPGYVACLRTASVQAEIDWKDLIYISPTYVGKEDQWVMTNDIMISMANSYALVGKVAIIREVPQKATFGGFLAAIRPVLIEPYFLLYVLRSPRMQAAFRARSSQTTNIANISLGRMRPLPFPLPPLAEQKRIVAKVDELMALCDRLEAQQQERETRHAALARASLARFAEAPAPANLAWIFHPSYTIPPADLRKAILTLAVQGKLVPQDPNDEPVENSVSTARKKAGLAVRVFTKQTSADKPFDTPDSWRWVTVADVADTRLGKMLDKEKNRGEAHPYLRNTNVHWFRFELESIKTMLFEPEELDEYRVEAGDVLICEGGHGIARSAVWDGQIPGIMFQKALHRVRPLPCLNGHFLTFCLWFFERDGILQRYYTGAGIPHFTGKALARVTFPLPPLAEQRRIVAKVDQLMALVDALERQLAASRATAEKLLAELTTS
jgi:type I restriction enzyme S subunit